MSIFGTSSYGPQRGFPIRWIIALIIAGIGLFTYFSSTQTNPVTGEKQHIAMTQDEEKALGLQAAPQMAARMGGALPQNDPDAQEVARIGHQIVNSSDAKRSPYYGNFNFYLLADPQTV